MLAVKNPNNSVFSLVVISEICPLCTQIPKRFFRGATVKVSGIFFPSCLNTFLLFRRIYTHKHTQSSLFVRQWDYTSHIVKYAFSSSQCVNIFPTFCEALVMR